MSGSDDYEFVCLKKIKTDRDRTSKYNVIISIIDEKTKKEEKTSAKFSGV